MVRTRRTRAAAVTAAALTLTVPAVATAKETVLLDARGPAGARVNGPVATDLPLVQGAPYYVRVAGTVSIYQVGDWTVKRPPCGIPETAPMFPSPGVANGQVGMDAETVFGVPAYARFHGYSCSVRRFPFRLSRYTDGGLQLSTGGGYSRPTPVGGPRDVPRADHTYLYAVTGAGAPLAVRWVDQPLDDDYGRFRVEVMTAAECEAERCLEAAAPTRDGVIPNGTQVAAGDRSPRRCVSRRRFAVRVRAYRGVVVSAGLLQVGERTRLMTRVAGRLQSVVDLRGLPFGTYRVRIVAKSTRGQRIIDDRTYRTCRVRGVRR